MNLKSNLLFITIAAMIFSWSCQSGEGKIRLLVFSKTDGYRHASIEPGIEAMKKLGTEKGWEIVATEDASIFTDENLNGFSAVIFLNTTKDVLDYYQQADFERYIQSGGGFVGIHAATDTEYEWPWYGKLVGAYFAHHPKTQEATIKVEAPDHPSTKMMPSEWQHTDEWYDFKNYNEDVNLLLTVDETSYEGGQMGDFHPISWYHEFDGGRSFYTNLGHRAETFTNDLFLQHITAGITYAIGNNHRDYTKAKSDRVPLENRFARSILAYNLNEPMELEILPDGRVLFVERKGAVKIYDQLEDSVKTIAQFEVYTKQEDGLLGVALDPDFQNNNWIYFFYSPVGEEAKQHVSRFDFTGEGIDFESEKVVLVIQNQRDECCHSGGSLEFGPEGNLFISVGDDTNPFASDGYAPIDEREGRKYWDAQRTSSNANDLRGKILRITPQPDGTYTIPEGNLFPEGTEGTRPEIYVMGCRNPFRISLDYKNNYLYWGDVGPDAGKNGDTRGPKGLDELNQARQAGYWGWPYTRGNNQQYYHYDFTSQSSGKLFDPENPINESPNNTGIKNLPPIQKSLIWYSYDRSEEFPWVGTGGKNPMAGPVFYSDRFRNASNPFPEYFDGKIFFYEWIRDWIYIITLDENGEFEKAEPFMANATFNNPIDMAFAPNGDLYILEYGEKWFAQNLDARLNRIRYVKGNREPIAKIEADKLVGGVPLTVQFSGENSEDFDGDALAYEWFFDSPVVQSREEKPAYTFEKEGSYTVTLKVTDPSGQSSSTSSKIMVGNDPPMVSIELDGNNEYYWSGRKISYKVVVTDKEDGNSEEGSISAENILVTMDFIPEGKDITVVSQGHQVQGEESLPAGRKLIDGSDCKACHATNERINGPSYTSIAEKYSPKDSTYLITKIINGGGGIWGETVMSAHPQLSRGQVAQMVDYILGLSNPDQSKQNTIPVNGSITLNEHRNAGQEGIYVLMASYMDKGNGEIPSLMERDRIILRYPRLEAEDYDEASGGITKHNDSDTDLIGEVKHNRFIMFKNVNIEGLSQMKISNQFRGNYGYAGEVEVHTGSQDGPVIGTASWSYEGTKKVIQSYNIPVTGASGVQDIYLVFKNEKDPDVVICNVDAIELLFK